MQEAQPCCSCVLQVRSYSLVAHVHYDSSTDAFTSPENTEEIKEEVSPNVLDPHKVTLHISGANICLASLRYLQQLDLNSSQLHPCHKHVKAIRGSVLICKCWIPATFKTEGYTTIQPLHIREKVERLYFS